MFLSQWHAKNIPIFGLENQMMTLGFREAASQMTMYYCAATVRVPTVGVGAVWYHLPKKLWTIVASYYYYYSSAVCTDVIHDDICFLYNKVIVVDVFYSSFSVSCCTTFHLGEQWSKLGQKCVTMFLSSNLSDTLRQSASPAHYVWFSWFWSQLKMSRNIPMWLHDYIKD